MKSLFARWELWITFLIGAITTVNQWPGLINPAGKTHMVLGCAIAVMGMFAGIFGERLTRGENPRERSTDVVPPPIPDEPTTKPAVRIPLDGPK